MKNVNVSQGPRTGNTGNSEKIRNFHREKEMHRIGAAEVVKAFGGQSPYSEPRTGREQNKGNFKKPERNADKQR